VTSARPLVKHAELVRTANELPAALSRAFDLATSGRPGPVLVDIPKDVQQASFTPATPRVSAASSLPRITDAQLSEVLAMLQAAERPVLYVGGGVVQSGAHDLIAALARGQDLASPAR